MIPTFPNFQKLDISHKQEIEESVGRFPPYSDYNFVSLFSWNVNDKIELSKLHDNLVVKFEDYITNEIFLSFLGTNRVEETILQLLRYANKEGITPKLKLIPEDVIQHINEPSKFEVEEDEGAFDYILSVPELAQLKDKKHYSKLKHSKKFKLFAPDHEVVLLNLSDEKTYGEIMKVFEIWVQGKNKTQKESKNELNAIQRLLTHAKFLNLAVVGVYHKKLLIGFSIGEKTPSKYVHFHFVKADPRYPGIFSYLYHLLARHFHVKGYEFMNIQQDLGIEGLREAKKQWHPVNFLKKYTVSLKN